MFHMLMITFVNLNRAFHLVQHTNLMLWHNLNEAWATLKIVNTDKTKYTFRLLNAELFTHISTCRFAACCPAPRDSFSFDREGGWRFTFKASWAFALWALVSNLGVSPTKASKSATNMYSFKKILGEFSNPRSRRIFRC